MLQSRGLAEWLGFHPRAANWDALTGACRGILFSFSAMQTKSHDKIPVKQKFQQLRGSVQNSNYYGFMIYVRQLMMIMQVFLRTVL